MTSTYQPFRVLLGPWRVAVPVMLAVLAVLFAAYWGTATSIFQTWMRSGTFTHGFLVPPIVAWLIWQRRHQLADMVPVPNFWFLLLLAAVVFGWFLGELASVNAVTQLAFVSMLVLAVPAILGLAVARAIVFPLAFLFFAVPIGEFAMPQLMLWTADFTIEALRLSGIPVYREGLQFVIPSGNWSVVEACSGVRYLIASLTVGTLFAYINYQSMHRRLLFIGVSILVPIVANWLRAYFIVMLGHYSSNKLATGVDHLVYGWLFFGVVIMLMFMIGARWSEPDRLESGGSKPHVAGFSAHSSNGSFYAVALCFAALVCLPQWWQWKVSSLPAPSALQLELPRAKAPDWQSSTPENWVLKPRFLNPSAQTSAIFSNGGKEVGLYLGFYQNQNFNRKLVSSSNALVSSSDSKWVEVNTKLHPTQLGGKSSAVKATELRAMAGGVLTADARLEVWQIYWIGGTLTSNDYAAKVYSAFYRLMGRGDDSAVIVVYTQKTAGGEAQSVLQRFMDDHYSQIDAALSALKRQN